jgi:dolichol-phosphate mannosyltransferase
MKNELIVLLPAYNEELNVEKMVDTWMKQGKVLADHYQLLLKIVVVNDGSKDHTEDICRKIAGKYDNFRYISHPHNKGLGEAVKTALTYVVLECPDCRYACVMDCDNTQDPCYIGSMLDKIGAGSQKAAADIVIASRYQKGAKVQGVAGYRLLTSEGAKYVYSLILHVKKVRDYTCGYRLYTKDILAKCYERFGSSMIEESGFTCMAELLYKLYTVGARFEEVPFVLRYDFKQGKSKMKVIKTAMNSIKLAFRLRRLKRIRN